MNIRRITSLTMFLSFVLLMLTSIILYIVPHGRVAYWADWHLWGISKTEWGNLHINLGVLLLIAFAFHLYFNFNVFMAYLKNKTKELRIINANFNAAFLLTLLFCIGTYFMVPPLSYVIHLGEFITEKADVKYGEPPYGHAELSSLNCFSISFNPFTDSSVTSRPNPAQLIVFSTFGRLVIVINLSQSSSISSTVSTPWDAWTPPPSSSLDHRPQRRGYEESLTKKERPLFARSSTLARTARDWVIDSDFSGCLLAG